MAEEPLHQILLLKAVREIGAVVEAAPLEWTGHTFNAEQFSFGTPSSGDRQERYDRDLPRIVGAARLDTTPVLIGEIVGPADRGVVEDAVRRYRNQATIARSWLGSEAPSLQLFLVGPTGALEDVQWRQLAASIEADDRVCRKVVWLYEEEPTLGSAKNFLDRTFLARPWQAASKSVVELDSMSETELPAGWEVVIDQQDLDTDSLVRKLIDLESGVAE